jgi:hypothetical protein
MQLLNTQIGRISYRILFFLNELDGPRAPGVYEKIVKPLQTVNVRGEASVFEPPAGKNTRPRKRFLVFRAFRSVKSC